MSPSVSQRVTSWPEQVRVAGVLGEQAFELRAGGAEVAGGRVRLGDAHGHLAGLVGLAPLALQPFEQPVELVVLQVELRDALDDAELAFEFVGLLERPPQQFDRLALADALAQRVGERDEPLRVGRVGPHRAPQGFQPLLLVAELEAEVGEELVDLGVARRRGEQVAAGLQRLLAPAEPLLELGDGRAGIRCGSGGRARRACGWRRRPRAGCRRRPRRCAPRRSWPGPTSGPSPSPWRSPRSPCRPAGSPRSSRASRSQRSAGRHPCPPSSSFCSSSMLFAELLGRLVHLDLGDEDLLGFLRVARQLARRAAICLQRLVVAGRPGAATRRRSSAA